jgi:hypothetical protein
MKFDCKGREKFILRIFVCLESVKKVKGLKNGGSLKNEGGGKGC